MTSLAVESSPRNSDTGSNRRKGKKSTREKIERLVAEGAKNYPAYLKLIYTGDSEQSSEEENNADLKNEAAVVPSTENIWDAAISEDVIISSCATNMKTCEGSGVGGRGGGILSPESDKLLDPGKEKPSTPTNANDNGKEGRASADDDDDGEMCMTDHAKQYNDSEYEKHQQNVEEKWKLELFQLQDDIVSLKAMLNGKLQIASELKQRLGITPMTEFKIDLRHTLLSFKESGTFVKTNAVLRSLGAYASRKMGTIRNSVIFKSVEEKVGKVKSRSMSHIKSKLNRKLPASKSDSNVAELKRKELEVSDDGLDDLNSNPLNECPNSSED